MPKSERSKLVPFILGLSVKNSGENKSLLPILWHPGQEEKTSPALTAGKRDKAQRPGHV